MPATISIQFLWGRYHATSWLSAVNDGTPEWPPSPWRILRAIVATKYNKFPEINEATFSNLVKKLAFEPPIFLLPEISGAHTRHYMPQQNFQSPEKILDAFVALPRSESSPIPVIVNWPNIDLSSQETELLNKIVSGITYLGRADSQCIVTVLEESFEHLNSSYSYKTCRPKEKFDVLSSDETKVDVLCLSDHSNANDLLRTLKLTVKKVRSGLRRSLPPGTELVTYMMPDKSIKSVQNTQVNKIGLPVVTSETNAVIFNIFTTAQPSIYAGVVMAEALRKAAMSNYGRLYYGAVSENLSGKNSQGQPLGDLHFHSHYLALRSPNRHTPLLNKLVVWCPAGFDANEILSLSNIRELGGSQFLAARDFRPCQLGFEGYGNISNIAPWIVSSDGDTEWQSLTPFCSSRPAEWRSPSVGELKRSVEKECAYRGFPEPTRIEQFSGNRNWNTYRTHRQTGTGRGLRNARPAYGLQIEFPEPVHGPISLGALSHFGLGLFEPKKN